MQNFTILVYFSQPLLKEETNKKRQWFVLVFFNQLTKKLCRNADKAFLWALRDPELHQSMAKRHQRTRFIPSPSSLWLSTELNDTSAFDDRMIEPECSGCDSCGGRKDGWHCGWIPHPFPWAEGAWQAHRQLLQKCSCIPHLSLLFIDSKCCWASVSPS